MCEVVCVQVGSGARESVFVSERRVGAVRSAVAEQRGVARELVVVEEHKQTRGGGARRRRRRDDEMLEETEEQVAVRVELRGGHQTEATSYILPIILTVLFVGCAIAGPVLVVRESNANLMFQTVWWVGCGLCIAAACLLIILIPVWIYMLCCD